MLIGKSLVKKKRIYVHGEAPQTVAELQTRGYEVISLSDFPRFMYIKSERGYCSTPYGTYSAKHCFAKIYENAEGREYTLVLNSSVATGRVVHDPNGGIAKRLKRMLCGFFHSNKAFHDWVVVEKFVPSEPPIAVLSAGVVNENIILAAPVGVTPKEHIGRTIYAKADFPAPREIRGAVVDYGIFYVLDGTAVVPIYAFLIKASEPAVPGNSGAPIWCV